MQDMFAPPPEEIPEGDENLDPFAEHEEVSELEEETEEDPFDDYEDDEDVLEIDSVESKPPDVDITEDLPYIDVIDSLPGVGKIRYPKHLSNKETVGERKLLLAEANKDVKEFTDEIHARRIQQEEDGEFPISDFIYDVQAVRLMGQTGCSNVEMASYFGIDEGTIGKLMRDPTSDFFKVYNKANSILKMTLRQSQIKTALSGDSKMQIHLGKHMLNQVEGVAPPKQNGDLSKNRTARKQRIVTLTQTITEFDD